MIVSQKTKLLTFRKHSSTVQFSCKLHRGKCLWYRLCLYEIFLKDKQSDKPTYKLTGLSLYNVKVIRLTLAL